jgi:superfamily II DNA or RNA helicase
VELRYYQRESVDAVWEHLRNRRDNPVVVIPTGGGKTPCMAEMCRQAVERWNGRVLVLSHSKELISQSAEKLNMFLPSKYIGVFSAGLKKRDREHQVLVAGIQSVYRRACDLGVFNAILIDECQLLPPDGEGLYRSFLSDAKIINPNVRLVGWTATPYRLGSGELCGPDNLLNHICYEVGVKELISEGYLSPLISKAGVEKADVSRLHIRGGEFIAGEAEELMNADELVKSAVAEIVQATRDRNSCLIFCASVKHAEHVVRVFREEHGLECGFVEGNTPSSERENLIARFKGEKQQGGLFDKPVGPLKYLANINILSVGFDAPGVDCVAMLRPTASAGLFYQQCLDSQTEVLTNHGWVGIDHAKAGDVVAAFDMQTESIQWAESTHKTMRPLAPDERMFGVSSPHLDVRVTAGHTMLSRGRGKTNLHWQQKTAEETAERRSSYCIPVAGIGDGPGLPLSDDEIHFLGWFLTDGYLNPKLNTIDITQSVNGLFVDEIRRVLEGCGFGYGEYRQKRKGEFAKYSDGLHFVIPFGKPRGTRSGLRGWSHLMPYVTRPVAESLANISMRQLGLMLESMNQANGAKPQAIDWKPRGYSISLGGNRFLADNMQALLVQRGYRCNLTAVQPKKNDWCAGTPAVQYTIHAKKQAKATVGGIDCKGNKLVKNRCRLGPVDTVPGEMVWCLTNRFETLVTRRNGKVAIVGNCGRGFRLAPGKENCLILDFAENLVRHGPVDMLKAGDRPGKSGTGEAPARECPECHRVCHASVRVCPECGFEFPRDEKPKHNARASNAPVVSGDVDAAPREFEVLETTYGAHEKRNAPPGHPPSMRVSHRIGGYDNWVSEWVCPQHSGYAREKFVDWWSKRSHYPPPRTVRDAVAMAHEGCLASVSAVRVKQDANGYDRIIAWAIGDKPDVDRGLLEAIHNTPMGESWPVGSADSEISDIDLDDIPF